MKIIYTIIFLAALNLSGQSIVLSELGNAVRVSNFNKMIDEINNGKEKIKYSDINGIPYYYAGFVRAKVGETENYVPIRYNSFLDVIEIRVDDAVYEIPREDSYPKFTFEKTNEKLVLINSHDENAGYFFEISSGKNRILKKIKTLYHQTVPAPNSIISSSPARFETLKPIYFIKTDIALIKIPKNNKDLAALFPDRKDALDEFLKTNKIKLNQETDLIKLDKFLNN